MDGLLNQTCIIYQPTDEVDADGKDMYHEPEFNVRCRAVDRAKTLFTSTGEEVKSDIALIIKSKKMDIGTIIKFDDTFYQVRDSENWYNESSVFGSLNYCTINPDGVDYESIS